MNATTWRSGGIRRARWGPVILVLLAPAAALGASESAPKASPPDVDVVGTASPQPPPPQRETGDERSDVPEGQTAGAGAPQAVPQAIELGLRLGFAVPMGSAFGNASSPMTANQADINQGDLVSTRVPLWIDFGYRVPYFYIGLFLQFGFLSIPENMTTGCGQGSGISCDGHDITFGGAVAVDLAPNAGFDPWLGVGAGYEWLTINESAGGMSASVSLKGPQFVTFQAGGDIRTNDNFRFGPFASLSVGQYQSASAEGGGSSMSVDIPAQTLHEWLTVGIRGAFEFRVERRAHVE